MQIFQKSMLRNIATSNANISISKNSQTKFYKEFFYYGI